MWLFIDFILLVSIIVFSTLMALTLTFLREVRRPRTPRQVYHNLYSIYEKPTHNDVLLNIPYLLLLNSRAVVVVRLGIEQ